MNEVVETLNQALARQFFGRKISKKSLGEWIELEWKPLLSYIPKFHLIIRGNFNLK
jgi:hypothetical protein